LRWGLLGEHNRMNALAAIAAARHAGVPAHIAIEALSCFKNVKRRMELHGTVNGIRIYDDFAHHPTAIRTTLAGLREQVGPARILAILEPRSNTMKLGTWQDSLAASLALADRIFCYTHQADWDVQTALAALGGKAGTYPDFTAMIEAVASAARPDDHVLIMSNGSFNGLHAKLLARLGRTNPIN
ncbi:MAG TPA: cyanophycin synthetase, partial [Nitrosomonas halophila]|nr:cyanophycin synthetase [Nitrosomonas halophila]